MVFIVLMVILTIEVYFIFKLLEGQGDLLVNDLVNLLNLRSN